MVQHVGHAWAKTDNPMLFWVFLWESSKAITLIDLDTNVPYHSSIPHYSVANSTKENHHLVSRASAMRSFDDQANHVEISQSGLYRVSLSRSNRGSAAACRAKQPDKYNNAGMLRPTS
jgi:hypothetical protein